MSSSKLSFIEWFYILLVIIVVVVLIVALIRPFNKVSNIRDVTVTVTEKAEEQLDDVETVSE